MIIADFSEKYLYKDIIRTERSADILVFLRFNYKFTIQSNVF